MENIKNLDKERNIITESARYLLPIMVHDCHFLEVFCIPGICGSRITSEKFPIFFKGKYTSELIGIGNQESNHYKFILQESERRWVLVTDSYVCFPEKEFNFEN